MILKRDNFTCKICGASVKENKGLRLEVGLITNKQTPFKANPGSAL
jgi:hypothetical protein